MIRVTRYRRGLGRTLTFVALNSGNDALVVTYEAIEAFFQRPGIRTGHFNAISGLNQFKDVRALFVIGRPLPDPRSLREQALALTGEPIPEESGHTEQRGVLRTDGSGTAIDVRAFEHPTLEALKSAITDAEIVQAIGRGRGVWRTADTPLNVFLLADVVTSLPVERLEQWSEVRPDVVERMAARGLVLLGATDAARIYDDLFPTAEGARKALDRARVGDFPDKPLGVRLFLGRCPGNRLVPVTYRPAGRGQQTRRAWVVESRLASLATWLTERLGSSIQVTPVAQPPVPAPDTPKDVHAPLRPERPQTAVQPSVQPVRTYQHPWWRDETIAPH